MRLVQRIRTYKNLINYRSEVYMRGFPTSKEISTNLQEFAGICRNWLF